MFKLLLLIGVGFLIWRWLPSAALRGPGRSAMASDHSPDPWAVLGLRPGAPEEEIRQAFRRRMAEYHPDRVRDMGVELREIADRKSREITQAYEQLRGRGRARTSGRPPRARAAR